MGIPSAAVLRPPRGCVKLIFTKPMSHVSLEQTYDNLQGDQMVTDSGVQRGHSNVSFATQQLKVRLQITLRPFKINCVFLGANRSSVYVLF